jgi:hypothetical protein
MRSGTVGACQVQPWNLKGEVVDLVAYMQARGAKFMVPIPELSVI